MFPFRQPESWIWSEIRSTTGNIYRRGDFSLFPAGPILSRRSSAVRVSGMQTPLIVVVKKRRTQNFITNSDSGQRHSFTKVPNYSIIVFITFNLLQGGRPAVKYAIEHDDLQRCTYDCVLLKAIYLSILSIFIRHVCACRSVY